MAREIQLNKITKDELAKMKLLDDRQIDLILEYRTDRGRIRNPRELYGLKIPRNVLDRFLRNTDVRLDDLQPPARITLEKVIELKQPTVTDQKFAGYRVDVAFSVMEQLDGRPRTEERSAALVIEAGNTAVFAYLSGTDFVDDITFTVKSPTGDVLKRQSMDADKFLDGDKLVIEVVPKVLQLPAASMPPFKPAQRIQGRLIDLSNRRDLLNCRIVLLAATVANAEPKDFAPVATAVTLTGGYFETTYPDGKWTRASAQIGVDGGVSVPVRLEGDAFPKRLVLILPDPATVPGAGCDCDPDCVASHLKTANQVLDEFAFYAVVRTSEPPVQALTLDENDDEEVSLGDILKDFPIAHVGILETAKLPNLDLLAPAGTTPAPARAQIEINRQALQQQKIRRSALRDFIASNGPLTPDNIRVLIDRSDLEKLRDRLKPRFPATGRMTLDAAHALDWDQSPTIYQAVGVAHGHLLEYRQEWISDGYSLGDLVYSLALAPGQRKQIVVFDWERRESASNIQSLDYREALNNTLSRDRDVNEIANGMVTESTRGGSDSSTQGGGGGAALGGVIPGDTPMGFLVGAAGGGSHADASSFQDSARQTSLSNLQSLRDRTTQAANGVRSQRSTVIQSVAQGERFEAQTEVIANYNHCHSITIQYYEVLRHFRIQHRLVDARECLFVPLCMTRFDADKALRWREILSRYLLRNSLRRGFSALERIRNHYVGSDLPLGAYADDDLNYMDGELRLLFRLARPDDDKDGKFQKDTWNWMRMLLPFHKPEEFFDNYLKDQKLRDQTFLRELGPEIAQEFVRQLRIQAEGSGVRVPLPLDLTVVSEFRNREQLVVTIRLFQPMPSIRRRAIEFLRIHGAGAARTAEAEAAARAAGLDPQHIPLRQLLPSGSQILVQSATIRYRTAHYSGYLTRNSRVEDDLGGADEVLLFTPLCQEELRKPREEDQELATALVAHLNENLDYYHKVIYMRMSPERRFLLLDGVLAPGPNANGRSVASVVENRLIGIVGNSLVLPVAPGVHLDPSFEPKPDPASGELVRLINFYQADPPDPIIVSLPTKGIFAEAVKGRCNSCEKKEEDRFWRWEESIPPDSPTQILPISTDTRRAEPPLLTPTPFPNPIVNVQNAPPAPDPSGLQALVGLLGNANIFRDATGLTETQRNAIEALRQAFGLTQFFGSQAAALTTLATNTSGENVRQIQSALRSGLLSTDQARNLTDTAIRSGLQQPPNSFTLPGQLREIQRLVDDKALTPEEAAEVKKKLLDDGLQKRSGDGGSKILKEPVVADMIGSSARDAADVTFKSKVNGEQIEFAANKTTKSGGGAIAEIRKGAASLAQTVGNTFLGALSQWKSEPNSNLGGILQKALLETAKKEANKTTISLVKRIPVGSAFVEGVKIALAFADGAGKELEKTNKRLTKAYDDKMKLIFSSDEITDESFEAMRQLSAYQFNATRELNGILRAGIDKALEEAIDFGIETMGEVLKESIGEFISAVTEENEVLAILNGFVSKSAEDLPEARRNVQTGLIAFLVKGFIKQLPKSNLQSALKTTIDQVRGTSSVPSELVAGLCFAILQVETGSVGTQLGISKDEVKRQLVAAANRLMNAAGVLPVNPSPAGDVEITSTDIKVPPTLIAEIQGFTGTLSEGTREMRAAAAAFRSLNDVEEQGMRDHAGDLLIQVRRGRLSRGQAVRDCGDSNASAASRVRRGYLDLEKVIQTLAAAEGDTRFADKNVRRTFMHDPFLLDVPKLFHGFRWRDGADEPEPASIRIPVLADQPESEGAIDL